MQEQNRTGYPSMDKPWLKYYTQEAINTPLPQNTIYEHILQKNQDNLDRVCLNYYGTSMTYRSFFDKINTIASALERRGGGQGKRRCNRRNDQFTGIYLYIICS